MRGALAALSIVACVAPTAATAQEAVSDPWENLNRDLYAVHDAIDQTILEPAARGYRAILPRPARSGVRNFLRNLRSPVIFVNDVLQGEPSRAGVTAARFGLNTTIGFLGLLDPATEVGFERHDEDFGQTLAIWGLDAGPYLFVPVLGPTNVRDGFGRVVDLAFDPFTWAEFDGEEAFRITRTVTSGLSTREELLETVDDVRATSIDPYVTFRTTYDTLRQGQIQNGRTNVQDLPSFDDSFESFEAPTEAPESGENPQQSEAIHTSFLTMTLAGEGDAPTSALQPGETP